MLTIDSESPAVGIGLRVYSNKKVFYSIIRQTFTIPLEFLDVSLLNIPFSLDIPERLNFVRNTILDIMTEYEVTRAAIRISEFGRTLDQRGIERIQIEGVLQESLASSMVEKFVAGQISVLASLAGIARSDFKPLASGEKNFQHFPVGRRWQELSLEERESVLACYASLNL